MHKIGIIKIPILLWFLNKIVCEKYLALLFALIKGPMEKKKISKC